MEIRNCLYRGSLNRLIKELGASQDFKLCVNQANIEKRMTDRLLVLRFLAFYERTYLKANKGLKKFLNDFLDAYRDPPQEKLAEFENEFKKAMRTSLTVFGEYGFRLRKSQSTRTSEWTPRVNAAVFQVIAVSFTKYEASHATRNADAIFEEYLDLLSVDSRWVDSVSKSTGDTERIKYAFETWNNRLEAVMRASQSNNKTRCFSLALKKEMFTQSPVCAICKQQIRLVNDAALDHEQHYWRGGRTVPENARLVHRVCNLGRPL
jgi:HNH endonuclease